MKSPFLNTATHVANVWPKPVWATFRLPFSANHITTFKSCSLHEKNSVKRRNSGGHNVMGMVQSCMVIQGRCIHFSCSLWNIIYWWWWFLWHISRCTLVLLHDDYNRDSTSVVHSISFQGQPGGDLEEARQGLFSLNRRITLFIRVGKWPSPLNGVSRKSSYSVH